MSNPYAITGGARVGWLNASWPFARLSANSEQLTISIRLLDTYRFAPDQVSSIQRYVMIPFLGWGVQIHHSVADYPQRIIFWCLGNPNRVLQGIRDSGFMPTGSDMPKRRGIPMRWSAIIVAMIVWNALFFLSVIGSRETPPQPGPLILLPLVVFFALSIGVLKYQRLQRLILKPDRSIGEIRLYLRFLVFILGMMLAIFSVLLACEAFH